MKKVPEIEVLKKKRQKNVQEQNAMDKHQIMECARDFRNNKCLPNALIDYFEEQGVDTNLSVLLWHDRMPCGGMTVPYRGEWLTPDFKFYSYEIFLDKSDSFVSDVDEWKDITEQVEINEHKPGTGKTYGFMCIEVLNEINS